MPHGLRFNQPGAPATPHILISPGPPPRPLGQFTPGVIVPLEERGIPLEDARKLDKDPGCPLELVEIDKDGNEVEHQKGAGHKTTTADAEKGKD